MCFVDSAKVWILPRFLTGAHVGAEGALHPTGALSLFTVLVKIPVHKLIMG